jgi:serine/threonine-protein kinase RsbW
MATPSSPTKRDTLQLNVADALAAMTQLAAWVAALAERHELTQTETFRLEMALTESVANIADHAYDSDRPNCPAVVTTDVASSTITAVVTDWGGPFDPLAAAASQPPTDLQSAGVGGMGLGLLRHFTDTLRYERRADQNVLTLTLTR